MGANEDPATGSASGPLGCYLVKHGLVPAEKAGINRQRPGREDGPARAASTSRSIWPAARSRASASAGRACSSAKEGSDLQSRATEGTGSIVLIGSRSRNHCHACHDPNHENVCLENDSRVARQRRVRRGVQRSHARRRFRRRQVDRAAHHPVRRAAAAAAPACAHYGQGIFEGFKAFPRPNGGAVVFRPDANHARMAKTCQRMAMPEVPASIFIDGTLALVQLDRNWIPEKDNSALYVRPVLFATGETLGVKPSEIVPLRDRDLPERAVFHGLGGSDRGRHLRPRVPRRHRRGEVRRQLRRQHARLDRGAEEGLPQRAVARRHRAQVRRGSRA